MNSSTQCPQQPAATILRKPVLQNVYYMHVPLFVFDVIRMFQDHPKYRSGLKEADIVELLQQEKFANGDVQAQVESAIKTLEISGYIRFVGEGFRTLGPLAKLATAKTARQRTATWDKIQEKF